MRTAAVTIHKGSRRIEPPPPCPARQHIEPRADAIATAQWLAEDIAKTEGGTVEPCAPGWPMIARYLIQTPRGRFVVAVRDCGRM